MCLLDFFKVFFHCAKFCSGIYSKRTVTCTTTTQRMYAATVSLRVLWHLTLSLNCWRLMLLWLLANELAVLMVQAQRETTTSGGEIISHRSMLMDAFTTNTATHHQGTLKTSQVYSMYLPWLVLSFTSKSIFNWNDVFLLRCLLGYQFKYTE